MKTLKLILCSVAVLLVFLASAATAHASDASLAIPDLWNHGSFPSLGGIRPAMLLLCGSVVICGTLGISLYQLFQIKKQPAHKSMLAVSETIFQTCKTYLIQQGKFLLMLFCFIALAMAVYAAALAFHLSGAVAVVGAGMMFGGERAGRAMSRETEVYVKSFWTLVDESSTRSCSCCWGWKC